MARPQMLGSCSARGFHAHYALGKSDLAFRSTLILMKHQQIQKCCNVRMISSTVSRSDATGQILCPLITEDHPRNIVPIAHVSQDLRVVLSKVLLFVFLGGRRGGGQSPPTFNRDEQQSKLHNVTVGRWWSSETHAGFCPGSKSSLALPAVVILSNLEM